jgi:hypothetical protein
VSGYKLFVYGRLCRSWILFRRNCHGKSYTSIRLTFYLHHRTILLFMCNICLYLGKLFVGYTHKFVIVVIFVSLVTNGNPWKQTAFGIPKSSLPSADHHSQRKPWKPTGMEIVFLVLVFVYDLYDKFLVGFVTSFHLNYICIYADNWTELLAIDFQITQVYGFYDECLRK